MSRKRGGLKLLPPFTGSGEYEGIIDALENVRGYIERHQAGLCRH